MTARFSHALRLWRDTRGATIVEFAFVAGPLCLLLVGTLDLAYRAYMLSVLQGVVHQAARLSTLEGPSGDEIHDYVRAAVADLSPNGEVDIERRNYTEFTGVAQAEKITQDTDPIGECNPRDWYLDENFNDTYDRDRGRTGQGGADDIIQYSVSVEYPRMVHFGGVLGESETIIIAANTVMQNQPYAAQVNAEPQERQVMSC